MSRLWLGVAAALLLTGCAGQARAPVGERGTDVAEINVQLGMAYLQRGQYELALEKINKALDADSKLPGAHAAMGLLRERLGDRERASVHYQRALALAPDDPTIQHNYGVFLCGIGEYEKARHHILKAAANPLYGTPAMAYTNAAICARSEDDLTSAERYLSQALEKNPLYAQAHHETAVVRLIQGRPRESHDALRRFWRVAGQTPESLELAVRVAEALGDDARVEEYRRRLREQSEAAPLERDMRL